MAATTPKGKTQTPPPKVPHEQQLNDSSAGKAAASNVSHPPVDFLAPPTSSNNQNALEQIQLPDGDRAIFSNLKEPAARCCVANFVKCPKEASVCFKYLNQGGANLIFTIHSWSPTTAANGEAFVFVDAKDGSLKVTPIHHSELISRVLRVDKGLNKTLRCDEIISGFYGHVWPLFAPEAVITIVVIPEKASYKLQPITMPDLDFTTHLMDHQGVALYPSVMLDIASKANAVRKDQAQRPLHTQRWGILLPDMSPTAGSSVTIEVKPKWLAQSPTAPTNAIRCRTCALQIIKPKDPKKYICPLQLLNGNWDTVYPWILGRVTEQISSHSPKSATSKTADHTTSIATHLAIYMTKGDGQSLLQHLLSLQRKLDHHGVLCRMRMNAASQDVRDAFDRNLRLAMTLRDCSLFIRIKYGSAGADAKSIECKLGDLDFKSADKIDDWLEKENELLKSDAYTRKVGQDLACWISRV
jgi:inositol-pentakisphosphate 2-kinase